MKELVLQLEIRHILPNRDEKHSYWVKELEQNPGKYGSNRKKLKFRQGV